MDEVRSEVVHPGRRLGVEPERWRRAVMVHRRARVPRATTTSRRRTVVRAGGLVRVTGAAAFACLVLAGCASDTVAERQSDGATVPPSTTVNPARDVDARIDIGNGRSMHLECRGAGAPTVLLIAGTGNAGDVWSEGRSPTDPSHSVSKNDDAVFPRTARSTRVCAYDRPGTQRSDGSPGGSSAVAQPTSTRDASSDLHALVVAAGISGPFVLVGHSLGGLIATTYARTYPDDVVGLVLVDPASQFMEGTMGPTAWAQYVRAALSRADTGMETIDPDASNRAVNALPPAPKIPVVVLSSDQPWFILPFGVDDAMVDFSNALLESQSLLATSLGATHITKTNSAHDISIDNAALVNEQICVVISHGQSC